MANVPGSHRTQGSSRPTGTRFRIANSGSSGSSRGAGARPAGKRFADGSRSPECRVPAQLASSAYQRPLRREHRTPLIPVAIGILLAVAVVAGAVIFVFPALFGSEGGSVEAGQTVELTIPDGASGDTIASLLSESHVVEDPAEYYAAVKKLGAEMSLKPGNYEFKTLQDPVEVVKLLVVGPNAAGGTLALPEGKTVAQTADLVEQSLGIPASDFLSLAKASNYVSDFEFLADVSDDSLEGFLYPKTYSFEGEPTADQVIRALLEQFEKEVLDTLGFDGARARIAASYGLDLTDYDLLKLASIVEREGLNSEQRAHVAGVFLNRLAGKGDFAGRPYLESDATLMYETGGEVTADDIQQMDSPYNSYKNAGLPPTPICSPSANAIKVTLEPLDTNDLYFFITQDEEYFSETYDEHMQSWE